MKRLKMGLGSVLGLIMGSKKRVKMGLGSVLGLIVGSKIESGQQLCSQNRLFQLCESSLQQFVREFGGPTESKID